MASVVHNCRGFLYFMETNDVKSRYRQGLLFGLLSSVCWGLFPLYWKMLSAVPAATVLAHRIVWSCFFLLIVVFLAKDRTVLSYLKKPGLVVRLTLAGAIVALNWGVYIYAVETDRIVEASLGYYINPLMNVLLGVVFLKEKLNTARKIAVGLALIGVCYVTYDYGIFPWISLVLACSFGTYGLLKKKANLESMPALTVETLMIAPAALGFLFYTSAKAGGTGTFFPSSLSISLLLVLGGVITALPLFLFGRAAQVLSLSTLGFIQYTGPTLQLIIGVLVFNEQFTTAHLVCFLFVWAGLTIYTFNMVRTRL